MHHVEVRRGQSTSGHKPNIEENDGRDGEERAKTGTSDATPDMAQHGPDTLREEAQGAKLRVLLPHVRVQQINTRLLYLLYLHAQDTSQLVRPIPPVSTLNAAHDIHNPWE